MTHRERETLSAFICAHQAGYVDDEQLTWVREVATEAEKSLNGYASYIRKQQPGSAEFGHQYVREETPVYQDAPIYEDIRDLDRNLDNPSEPPSDGNSWSPVANRQSLETPSRRSLIASRLTGQEKKWNAN